MNSLKIASELVRIAESITAVDAQEGDWSKKFVFTSMGVLGLDSQKHTNDGYRLVALPGGILRAVLSVVNGKQIEQVMLQGDQWAISVSVPQLHVLSGDFSKMVGAGMCGFRTDSSGVILFFKA